MLSIKVCKTVAILLISVTIVIMAAPVLKNDPAWPEWDKFKLENKRNYTDSEDAERFQIFRENLKKIKEHNEKFDKGEVTWQMGLNNFADMTPEERKQYLGYGVRRKEN